MTRCLTPDVLTSWVFSALPPERRAAADAHLALCSDCRERAVQLQRVKRADPAGAIDAVLEQLEAVLARLLTEPEHRWPLLATAREYRRTDLAGRLIGLAVHERERNTRRAAQLAHTAGVITDALTAEGRNVCDLRFNAWKLESALLREAGRYDECRAALVRAENAAELVPDVELARAAVTLSRALVCAEPDVWATEEALALLDLAEAVYVQHDPERLRATLTVRGMLLLRMGRAEEAKVRFETVLAQTSAADEAAYADAQVNLANALLSTGELAGAEAFLDAAFVVHFRCGRTANVARTRWLRARIHQSLVRHDDAIREAERATTELEICGLPEEAIRAALVAVQSYTELGALEDARALCERLAAKAVALDRHEPSRRRALTAEALCYLRHLAVRLSLTSDVVVAVRTYIDDVSKRPPAAFVPPLPLVEM